MRGLARGRADSNRTTDLDCTLRGWSLACASILRVGLGLGRCRRLKVEGRAGNRLRMRDTWRRRGGPVPKIPEGRNVKTHAQRAANDERADAQRRRGHRTQDIAGAARRQPPRLARSAPRERLDPFRA